MVKWYRHKSKFSRSLSLTYVSSKKNKFGIRMSTRMKLCESCRRNDSVCHKGMMKVAGFNITNYHTSLSVEEGKFRREEATNSNLKRIFCFESQVIQDSE